MGAGDDEDDMGGWARLHIDWQLNCNVSLNIIHFIQSMDFANKGIKKEEEEEKVDVT